MRQITIGSRVISDDSPSYVIAEIGNLWAEAARLPGRRLLLSGGAIMESYELNDVG